MSCPYLKEVVMLFCEACPIKKGLPLDRLASAHPCVGQGFRQCVLYQQAMRLREEGAPPESPPSGTPRVVR